MRIFKIIALVALCVLGASLLLNAGPNKMGIADTRQVKFENPTRIGN